MYYTAFNKMPIVSRSIMAIQEYPHYKSSQASPDILREDSAPAKACLDGYAVTILLMDLLH